MSFIQTVLDGNIPILNIFKFDIYTRAILKYSKYAMFLPESESWQVGKTSETVTEHYGNPNL